MIRKRNFLACSLCATLGLVSTSIGANAACATLAGKWSFFAMDERSPSIVTMHQNVVVGPTINNTKDILVFKNSGEAFNNQTTYVTKCTLTVAANGRFTGLCTSYGTSPPGGSNGTIRGTLALSAACDLSGSIRTDDPGEGLIVIQGGHINGNSGAGIKTRTATASHSAGVSQFNMVKQ